MFYICCMGGVHRLICIADNLNHSVLRRYRVQRLCDAHDRHLLADLPAETGIETTP